MIETIKTYQEGFYPMTSSEGWQVAYITYSDAYGEPNELKRHMTTDEVIIPIHGSATLYTEENGKIITMELRNDVLYNIKRATWHHLKISRDALLIVVENSSVTKESTERMKIHAHC